MQTFRNIFLIVTIFFFFLQKTKAQRFNFSFEQFTTDNGLSHESIIGIVKDKDGFIWLGTANGLNRFDGVSFKVFQKGWECSDFLEIISRMNRTLSSPSFNQQVRQQPQNRNLDPGQQEQKSRHAERLPLRQPHHPQAQTRQ